ncbi:MAG: hypothetical protein NWQ32_04370 [Paracoccaceae bacterium]|nr:hypothetical protein [Paracoccaceae bacterium]
MVFVVTWSGPQSHRADPKRGIVLDHAAVSPFISLFDRDEMSLPDPLAWALFPPASDQQAYAILDAARFFSLAQMLDAAGLPHRISK